MSAGPDAMTQMLQGLLGQQQAPQGGLMGALNQALAPYGGANQVALSLLGNKSGGSSFGSVLGQSLQNSQQTSMDNQSKKLQIAQQMLQMPAALYRAKLLQQAQGAPGTTLGGIQPVGGQPMQGSPQGAPQQPQGPQQGMSAGAPQQGQPNLPIPQEQQPKPAPSPFDVPDMDLGSVPVNNMTPQQAAAYEQVLGKDVTPTTAAENVRKAQLQVAQSAVAPRISTLDTVIKSADPTKYVSASPQLTALWRQLAPSIGVDPNTPQGFTPGNVRAAFGARRNELAAWAQLPASDIKPEEETTKGPLNSIYQKDPVTGKVTQVKGEEGLKQVIGDDGQPIYVTDSQAVGKKPFNASMFGASNMTDQAIQFAADTYRTTGKMPPAFARNPVAQAKVLDRVAQDATANGDTAGSIAARAASLKANGQALDQVTKLETATKGYAATLDKNLNNLTDAYAKAGSAGSPLLTRGLRIWQQGGTGDPQTASMVTWLNAVQGEYAKLKSGNLGNAPASDASMRDAKEVINKYMNQGGIAAVKEAMTQEAQNRLSAIAEQRQSLGGALGSNAPGSQSPVKPSAQTAPAAALQYLKANPQAAPQFKAKYGYLP